VTKACVEIRLQQNRLDEATKLNDAILKDSPSDPDALIARGDILIRQGKQSDAVPALATAVKNAPNNAMAHYQLGVAYAGMSNFGQAQSEWQAAARLRPNMKEAQRALAALAVRKGDAALLANSGEQLMKLEPKSSEGYIFHARALYTNGDKAGAEADLKKAIDVAPQDPAPYTRMGELRALQNQPEEAAKLYAQALALNPSASDALAGLVNIDLARKQPAQAVQRIQAQIAKAPNNSNFYLLLGQAELRVQNPGKAEEAFEKSIDLDKNNVTAFLFLATTESAHGSVDQAIGNYERALQDNPKDVRLYVRLGSLLETRGQWQQAQDLYQKALQIQTD